MCGFAVINIPYKTDEHWVSAMSSKIRHRGPDAQQQLVCEHVSMAHARLAVVGGDNAAQPMRTPDDRYSIVFNGEIYNYQALRRELEIEGARFSMSSDTEVLLLGYALWGSDVFKRLDGMYSAVIYDKQLNQLLCVRDRFGIKPLYYGFMRHGGIAVASELSAFKPLRDAGLMSCDINPQSLYEYLSFGYVVEPATWYVDTHALTPGTFLSWDVRIPVGSKASLKPTPYWSIIETMHHRTHLPTTGEGMSLLQHAVESHLPTRRETPFSIFLSGGLDSSILATISSQLRVGYDTLAVSAHFSDAQTDETKPALRLATDLGMSFHSLHLDRGAGLSADQVMGVFAEPFSDNAAIATMHLSHIAVKHGKVVLAGDGADEMFFGYRNHWLLNMETKLRPRDEDSSGYRTVLKTLAGMSSQSTKLPRVFRWKSTLDSLLSPLSSSYIQAMGIASGSTVQQLCRFKTVDAAQMLNEKLTPPKALLELNDPMKLIQWMDLNCYLPSNILKKVDRTTMSVGLEARVPFLSTPLASRMLAAPSAGQIAFNSGKLALRSWVKGVLPEPRRTTKKTSFTSPLDAWFSMMSDDDLNKNLIVPLAGSVWADFICINEVRALVESHRSGNRQHGPLLWALMVLSKFHP